MVRVRFHAGQVTDDDFAAMRSRLAQAEMVSDLLQEILGNPGEKWQ